jgi:uncharacterized flavoprotein (TIGR03862 family)
MTKRIAIVGSGPCGLMAATVLARAGVGSITLIERRPSFGRKLLVAGSSGLNISHDLPVEPFAEHYSVEAGTAFDREFWRGLLREFGPAEWTRFIGEELGLETFVGTSGRWFVREMKAANLLKRWQERLAVDGVELVARRELRSIESVEGGVVLGFADGEAGTFARVGLALGGGSWEDSPPVWPAALERAGIRVVPFSPANCGYEVAWKTGFLAEAEGKPLKNITLRTALGEKSGELVVTRYGLEGTPIYFLGRTGQAELDLKPDLDERAILSRLESVRENLAPIRRVKRVLGLGEASLALLFHHLDPDDRSDLRRLVARIKRFPLTLGSPRPLEEAISSRGGVALAELDRDLALRRLPGVRCGGEMLDWHAPTGGFLIQAAVSMGFRMGNAIAASLAGTRAV